MRILITGGSGLVGKSIQDISTSYPMHEFIFLSSKDVDLRKEKETTDYFTKCKPDYVIHLAANVGGLFKNMKYKVEMFEDNMKINLNVLKACHETNVTKLVSCLSTCIFPDQTTYPIDESMLHYGPPHWSNDSYAYSKRMLDVLSKAYRDQHGCNFICVIPCNVYGKWDNYSLENGHVIPALIHRAYLAKINKTPFVVKGSGNPLRQFIYSEDLARLMMWSLLNYNQKDNIILADEKEYSIGEIAKQIARAFQIEDQIVFDRNYEDGQFKKTITNAKLKSLIPYEFTNLETNIPIVVDHFVKQYHK